MSNDTQVDDVRTAIALSGIGVGEMWSSCLGYGSQMVDPLVFADAYADPSRFSMIELSIASVVVNERLWDMGLPRLD